MRVVNMLKNVRVYTHSGEEEIYIALLCMLWPVRDAEYGQYTGVRIKKRMLATSGK